MVDKFLQFFGLMRIRKAQLYNEEIVHTYARKVSVYVQEDFGIPPRVTLKRDAVTWANEAFDQLMIEGKGDGLDTLVLQSELE